MTLPSARKSVLSALRAAGSTQGRINCETRRMALTSVTNDARFLLGSQQSISTASSSAIQSTSFRRFSSASEAVAKKDTTESAAEAPTPAAELEFSTPRVKELYERMAKLKKEEVSLVGEFILETLDLEVAEDEFYYYGVGKSGGGKGGDAAAAEEVVEEVKKDTFDLKLMGFDDKSKIKVIKEVRTLTGLGLKEAKELVESAPKVIHKDLKTANAEELKEKLEAVGAQIELV